MRRITVHLVALLSLLVLAGCQPNISAPGTSAAAPRPTVSPTPAPVQVNLYALSDNAVVALNPADGSVRWQHRLTRVADFPIETFQAVQDTIFIQASQTLTALDSSDGKERWHISDYGFVSAANGTALAFISTTLSGLRIVDGKRLWSFPTDQGSVSARIAGDVVYVTNVWLPDSTLYALDVRDGKERWHFQQTDPMDVQAVSQESVYLTLEPPGGAANTLLALNQSNGQERWRLPSPNTDFFRGTTEVNGVVYVALNGRDNNGCTESPMTDPPGTLLALSASDGKTLWHSHPSKAGLAYVQPAGDQSAVYSADQQSGYAFNMADGQQLWSSHILQSSDAARTAIAQPIITGSLVYLSVAFCGLAQTVPVSFWALDKSDGHVVWHYQGVQRHDNQTAPLVLNGVVYVTTATGGVEALNGSDGKRLWQDDTMYLTHLVSNAG